MQAFEIESPIAVSESTSFAFSGFVIEVVAQSFILWILQKTHIIPKHHWMQPDIERIIDMIIGRKHKDPPPARTIISGTPQPKAQCLPGFPNAFTAPTASPIAAS